MVTWKSKAGESSNCWEQHVSSVCQGAYAEVWSEELSSLPTKSIGRFQYDICLTYRLQGLREPKPRSVFLCLCFELLGSGEQIISWAIYGVKVSAL